MEIITEINTTELFNIMNNYKTGNIKTFCNDLENNYYLFDKCINYLINYGYDITYILNDILVKSIWIETENELNNISYLKAFKLTDNLFLCIE